MNNKTDKDMAKIPILTEDELIELGKIMHLSKNDELAEERFWKEVYGKRGIKRIK